MTTLPTIDTQAELEKSFTDDLVIDGKIDGQSQVALTASGSITVRGKIDGQCTVILNAGGSIDLQGDISGTSHVTFQAGGDIHVHGILDKASTLTAKAAGAIVLDDRVDDHCVVRLTAGHEIRIGGKLDNYATVGGSADGSIEIDGKIDNHCTVDFVAGISIHLGDKIDNHSNVTLVASGGEIAIDGAINGCAQVTLRAKGPIAVKDVIDNAGTQVIWSGTRLDVANGIHGNAQVVMPDLLGRVVYNAAPLRPAIGLTVELSVKGEVVNRTTTGPDGWFRFWNRGAARHRRLLVGEPGAGMRGDRDEEHGGGRGGRIIALLGGTTRPRGQSSSRPDAPRSTPRNAARSRRLHLSIEARRRPRRGAAAALVWLML